MRVQFVAAAALLGTLVIATAVTAVPIVRGGGPKALDCMTVFDVPGANAPPPPATPTHVDCTDGNPNCDTDGIRNGRCSFDVQVCVNSTALPECSPLFVNSATVAHALDNGDPKFDTDFQALQVRVDQLGFPDNENLDACTLDSTITVALKGPFTGGEMRTSKKVLKVATLGRASGRTTTDTDRVRFICRPEGNALYLPTELYSGTFDRIGQQILAQRCALSGCHDSNTTAAGMNLLPNSAYSQIINVTPTTTPNAAIDGLKRILPGDPTLSLLYRKVTFDLGPNDRYGPGMPLRRKHISADLQELIRLWILGDMTLGPAPQTGWVVGTDQ